MARTTKTTKAQEEAVEKQVTETVEEASAKAVKQPAKKPVVKRTEIDPNRLILVKNATDNSLVYESKKTGQVILWAESGDEEYIAIQELMTMRSSQPRFLNEPWILIDDQEDDDIIQYLGLDKLYKNIINVDELDEFFSLTPQEIKEKLKIAPNGSKKLIADRAAKMIKDQTLYDNRIIKLLEEELKTDLSLLS
ncbi:hypothetical protein [Priestia megaterium]|uniref:hypothetical protein n=1 Tax=Priestia megaterium TaxID=1404 RepID=UPI0028775A72|nr:hypothetical protein [Priestia megaterium]